MKIKEILKNKWGWLGAGIYIALEYFLNNYSATRDVTTPFYINILNFPITLAENIYIPLTKCSSEYLPCFGEKILINIPIVIIFGFIIGLILQKIWRKFK